MARSLLREGQLRDADVLTEAEHASWVHQNLVTSGTLNFQDGTISGTGSIYANTYFGDGSGITGITADSPTSIAQGNSYVEVTDSGTGQIDIVADGTNVLSVSEQDMRLGKESDAGRLEVTDTYLWGYIGSTLALNIQETSQSLGSSAGTQLSVSQGARTVQVRISGNVYAQFGDSGNVTFIGDPTDTNLVINQSANSFVFESANTTEATINTNGLSLKSGTSVNEFSIDGTLAGNSDDAVPTEKAVKTYTDTNFFKDYQSNHVLNNLYLTDDIYIYKNTPSGISIRVGESGSYKYMSFDPDGILKVSSSTVWHAGNDGAGTGLDADKLDGQEGSYYSPADHNHTVTPPADAATTPIGNFPVGISVGSVTSGSSNYPAAQGTLQTNLINTYRCFQLFWHNTGTTSFWARHWYNGTWSDWWRIWHSGSDGSGSGLDADTLDSYHATSFQRPALTDTSGLAVQATDDWNNYKTTGFYRAASLSNETPYKAHVWQYTIVVQHNADYVVQLAKGYNSADPWSYRTLYNTVWSDWNKIYSDADIEFSTDTTLSGNSDSAVPTEKAVKTYVDTELAGISSNAISQGNSDVTVTDAGTGEITADVDGEERLSLTKTEQVLGHPSGGSYTTTYWRSFSNSPSFGILNAVAEGEEVLNLTGGIQIFGISTDTNMSLTQSSNTITFEANNTTEATINTNGLTLKSGASVNEFSTDGTLAGNSDDAVPTEKAVKTYVDGAVGEGGGSSSVASPNFTIRQATTSGSIALHYEDTTSGTLGLVYYDHVAEKLVISYHDPSTYAQENFITVYDGQVAINSDLDVNGDVTADSFNGYATDTARGASTIVVRSAGGDINVDDVYAYRGDGTGVIFLGDGSHYVYYNGTYYTMPAADLYVNGNRVPKTTISTSGPSGGTDGDLWFQY